MRSFLRSSLVTLGATALLVSAWSGEASGHPAGQARPGLNGSSAASSLALRKHGLIYRGLVRARSGPCRGVFAFPAKHGPPACTHGPDPSPAGIDVRKAPSLRVLRERALVSRRKGDASTVDCYHGGNAVQGIYAHQAGTDDYSTYAGYLQAYAAAADSVFQGSAAEQGGSRQLRWVTDASCNPTILDVTISRSASGDFTTMIDELRDQGFTDPSRKYLVWVDGSRHLLRDRTVLR